MTAFDVAFRSVAAMAGIASCVALAGCGFQLQGAGVLPPALERTYLVSIEPYSAFLSSLTDTLRLRGAEVVESESEASSVLRIVEDVTGQRVLSVTARNVPREFEVFYQVTFSLLVGGEQMIEPESLIVTRSYTYDETQVLAKAREEQELRRALADDLARRIVRRIEAAGANAAAPGTSTGAPGT
jgi:LPS-assembly lipoprotein